MKQIKVTGTWEQTFLVKEAKDVVSLSRKVVNHYPHLKLKRVSADCIKTIGE